MMGQVETDSKQVRDRAYRLIRVVKLTEAAIIGKGESNIDSLE